MDADLGIAVELEREHEQRASSRKPVRHAGAVRRAIPDESRESADIACVFGRGWVGGMGLVGGKNQGVQGAREMVGNVMAGPDSKGLPKMLHARLFGQMVNRLQVPIRVSRQGRIMIHPLPLQSEPPGPIVAFLDNVIACASGARDRQGRSVHGSAITEHHGVRDALCTYQRRDGFRESGQRRPEEPDMRAPSVRHITTVEIEHMDLRSVPSERVREVLKERARRALQKQESALLEARGEVRVVAAEHDPASPDQRVALIRVSVG